MALVKGALKLMAWTKAKMAIAVGVGVLLTAGTTVVTIGQVTKSDADDSWRSLIHFYSQSAMLADLDKTPPQVTILPTTHPKWGAMWWSDRSGRRLGMNSSITNLLYYAYGVLPPRMVFSEPTADGKYDFIANLPQAAEAAFRQKIKEQFGAVAHKAVIPTDVWVLKVSVPEKIKKSSTRPDTLREKAAVANGKWKTQKRRTWQMRLKVCCCLHQSLTALVFLGNMTLL